MLEGLCADEDRCLVRKKVCRWNSGRENIHVQDNESGHGATQKCKIEHGIPWSSGDVVGGKFIMVPRGSASDQMRPLIDVIYAYS